MIRQGLGALVAVAVAGAAQAGAPTDIVTRHMAAAQKGDVDGLIADYADNAVTLQDGRATQGKPEIRALFARMFPAKPAGAAPAASPMKITRVWEEGDVGFASWEMGPRTGVDEFLIRDGKIAVQAVFIGGAPAAGR